MPVPKTMKALVYYGKMDQRWEERPMPSIQKPTDAVVRMYKTTICGTDLHIMRGTVETVAVGRGIGHEGVGFIEEIGSGITNFKIGDKVLISCITSCGKCQFCKRGMYGQCTDGGWMLGNTIDGCQAEYVRIPHADNSLYLAPADIDDEALVMLSDILPTGLEVGVLDGKIQPGHIVAVVGAGPVGLAAILCAQFYTPGEIIVIDRDENRLKEAQKMGATILINNSDNTAIQQVLAKTKDWGVDVVIEAIGLPIGWEVSENIVCAGGHIAILGVHGHSVTLHLERMWKRNFTLSAGLVHTNTIPMLMKAVKSGKVDPRRLISHHFQLSEVKHAYDVFFNAAETNALKVILTNEIPK